MSLPTVALWHPFTARSIGWPSEAALPGLHSAPHVRALVELTAGSERPASVHYLTDRHRVRHRADDLDWWFWPRSRRRSRAYRREWSRRALRDRRALGADVTVINLSGHGSPFARALARRITEAGNRYAAMIGGMALTGDGEQGAFLREAGVVAVHNRVTARAVTDLGLGDRVVLVPLGVDLDQFSPAGPRTGSSAPVLNYVGRLTAWKGVEQLVDAHARVVAVFPDARLRLIGPSSDPGFAADLTRRIDRLGIDGSVDRVGPLPREGLPAQYRRADLTVVPSSGEGFGMVVVESMACGTPVIACDRLGGPADIITDGTDGVLCDPDQLAGSIIELLGHDERRAAMGRAARRTAEVRYGAAVTTDAFGEVIERTAAG